MLVLSRKNGQRIRIGRNIFVTLVRCQDGKARIGIEAPDELDIVRTEIDSSPPDVGKSPCPLDRCCPLGQCRLEEGDCKQAAS